MLLQAAAKERVELLAGAASVEGDALAEVKRRRDRAQAALAEATARCLAASLDEATTVRTIAVLQERYSAAVERERWLH